MSLFAEETETTLTEEDMERLLYDNRYAKFEFDLTKARTEPEKVDLLYELGTKARRMYILRADDTAWIRLNALTAPEFEAVPGLWIDRFYISSFYVRNPASAVADAKLVILVFYRV